MKRMFGLILAVALVPAFAFASSPGDALSDGLRNWTAPPYWSSQAENADTGARAALASGREALVTSPTPLPFVAVAPCRVIDTRSGSGFPAGYGQPSMAGGGTPRTFVIAGQCGIPADARAVSFNFAVWAPTTQGDLRVLPAGGALPVVSTLNWEANILALANAAVVPLGAGGDITVVVDGPGTVDIFVDVNGRQYDPVGNTWTATSTTGAPSGRYWLTAVWTGSRMIVWGGWNDVAAFDDGGQYDPVANAWTATAATGAPPGRHSHTAVWTGSRMIILGGWNEHGQWGPGGQLGPVSLYRKN